MAIKRVLLLSALFALAVADIPAITPKEACDDAYLFNPDSTRVPGNGNWAGRYFAQGPCLGVSGIGVTETFQKTVLVIDRTDFLNSYMPLQGMDDQLAWAAEIDFNTPARTQRGLNVITNTFCSSGQHVKNGKFFSVGGDMQAGTLSNYINAAGGFSMRSLLPCKTADCDFNIDGKLNNNRWYPATILLADGRMMVVGGASAGVAINGAGTDVPSLEYYPDKAELGSIDLPFLTKMLPYNLYPFVHLLPNGEVFIFAADSYILWSTEKNAIIPGARPPVGAVDGAGNKIVFSYPIAGSSAMFTLSPKTKYEPEIMVCGGGPTPAYAGLGDENAFAPASNKCFRINPLAPKAVWTPETMKLARVMPMCVLLPDGHLMIHGGAATGHQGIPNSAHNASLSPDIYNMNTHTFYDGDTGLSKIPRVYHASSVIMHDATVFISGSNPHQDGIQVMGDDYPTEFRTELYYPPYFRLRVPPPRIINAPVDIKAGPGNKFFVAFKAKPGVKTVSIVLSQPGFSTHNGNHGMRQVELELVALKKKGEMYAAEVLAPPSLNIAPPTYYWLFVVADGMPSRDGHHVFVN